MKILLVGASSDIACDLFARYNNEYQFVRLSSDKDYSDIVVESSDADLFIEGKSVGLIREN